MFYTFTDQLDSTTFPLISECQHRRVDLILVSDAASEDYATHLKLLSKVVDILSSGQESPENLRVAMAVSGSDSQGRPEISWLFQLATFSNTSDIKSAIIGDSGRQKSAKSYLTEAVEFVDGTVKDFLMQIAASNISDTTFDADLEYLSNKSRSHDEIFQPIKSLPIKMILVLRSRQSLNHIYNSELEPNPERFNTQKKLLVVSINSQNDGPAFFHCSYVFRNPCIELLVETMLDDHSLGLALCDRCFHGWFGPLPTSAIYANNTFNVTHKDPVLAYKSCYKLMPLERPDSYGQRAADICKGVGASLVSLETEMEMEFLNTELEQRCLTNKECPGNSATVFIGLRRNENSLGKRFRWINERPLIYNKWLPGYPMGGLTHGCTVWDVSSGGWVDIGCGRSISRSSALCEWTITKNSKILEISLPVLPSKESVQRALTRGQVGFCDLILGNVEPIVIYLPSNLLVDMKECYFQTNNTGRVQMVNMPLNRELVFQCNQDHFGSKAFSKVCDQSNNCGNGQDENPDLCKPASYLHNDVFTCVSSQTDVDAMARCDLYADCVDKSDEESCKSTCQFGLCSDGRCVPQTWLIDGEKDCSMSYGPDRHDLNNSVNFEVDCALLCNRSKCVPWSKLGDGVVDCQGPEGPLDETLGALERADCGDHLSMVWAPRCVYEKDRLGEVIGCRNMRHLHGCEDFICPEGYIKCLRAYCIPLHYLFNGYKDCPMGEDEPMQQNMQHFIPGFFRCHLINSVVIHPDRICDGSRDCQDGTDEMDCHVTCKEGFLCASGFLIADGYDSSEPLANISFIDPRTRMIDLSHINVSLALPAITDLELNYLIDLRLSNCSLNNVLGPYQWFPRLSKLDLSYNLFRNISHGDTILRPIYGVANSLRFLNLSYNSLLEVFDTSTISSNTELRILDLSHTALTTFPRMINVAYSLTHLNLSHTRIKSLAAFTFPQTHKTWNLEVLDLRSTDIVDVKPDALIGLKIVSDLHSDYFKLCCPQLRGEGIPAHTCHAPSDPLSSCSNLLENRLLRILVWMMGVASLLGNTGVIITRFIAGRKTIRLPYAQLVTQLGVSDFLMGVYLLILASKDVQYDGEYVWHDNSWRHSDLCKIAGFLSTLSSEVSSAFILLITIDRYLVIKYPFGQHRLSQVGTVTCSIFAWILGLILAAVPLFPRVNHWDVYSSNAVCLGLPLLAERRAGWQFSVAVFIALNCLLCLCITLGQLGIYRAVSATRKAAPVSTPALNTNSANTEISPRMKQDLALARRLAAIALTDLLCWVPIGVLGLLSLGGHSLGGEAYAWMAVFVMPINSALNPALYSLPVIQDHVVKAVARCMTRSKMNKHTLTDATTSSRI